MPEPVVTKDRANAESCRRYREKRKRDPGWVAAEREKTRQRVREYRARQKGEPSAEEERDDLLDELAYMLGFIDREPEPDDRVAKIRWKHWRDIRKKELATGESIFRGTCPEDLTRYRRRFGLVLLAEQDHGRT